MARTTQVEQKDRASLATLTIVAGVIAALYFGREVLIPLALAVMLAFVLAPAVTWLRRIGLPRVPAVVSVVVLAFVLIGGIGLVVGSQVVNFLENLPTYQQNISAKIRSLRESAPDGGLFDRAAETIRDLERELAGKKEEGPGAAPPRAAPAPQDSARQEPSLIAILGDWALPVLGPLGTAGLVIVFIIFFLLGREDLRNRAIRLMGGDVHAATEAMDEAAQRVSRYLLVQLLINTGTSIPFGIALYFIGVPNALLWAVLAVFLRFIPYIGPLIAALLPAAVAAAVDPGWGMLLWTVAIYVVMEAATNNFIEPRLQGASTGISEVAIIMSAIFWTVLWGPVGLFLATPLTVCIAVMGRHVPRLAFLDVLLGKTPALSPTEHFYQRMLAGDAVEGTQIAEAFLKERPLAAFYDEVALPALNLAERDRQRGSLAPERRAAITENVLEVIDDLAEHEDTQARNKENEAEKGGPEDKDEAREKTVPPTRAEPVGSVLCLAARTGFDFAAASMLTQLLGKDGFKARSLPSEAISLDGIASLDVSGFDVLCLCYVGFANTAHARHLLRRIRRRAQRKPVVVAFWPRELRIPEPKVLSEALAPARIVCSAGDAANVVRELINGPEEQKRSPARVTEIARNQDEPYQPPATPPDEEERLEKLRQLRLLDTPAEERFDRITRELARAFSAPFSLLSLVDQKRQYWKSQVGLPADLAAAGEAPRKLSICGHVVAENEMLVIEDVLKDKRCANNPFLRERGIRFYAGAPLRTSSGHTIGSLCVMDTAPRSCGDRERDLLKLAASQVVEEIERGGNPPLKPKPAAAPVQ